MIDFNKAATMASGDPDPRDVQGENPFKVRTISDMTAVFDLVNFDKQAEDFRDRIKPINAEISSIVVSNDATLSLVVEKSSTLAKVKKSINRSLKETIEKPNNFVKTCRQLAKKLTDYCDEGIDEGKRKIGSYEYQKEQDRRKAEAEANRRAKELQAELKKQAETDGTKPVKIPDAPIPVTKTPMRTETGTASTRFKLEIVISDFDAIPRKYLVADMKKIKAALDAGLEVPGISQEEKPIVSLRT